MRSRTKADMRYGFIAVIALAGCGPPPESRHPVSVESPVVVRDVDGPKMSAPSDTGVPERSTEGDGMPEESGDSVSGEVVEPVGETGGGEPVAAATPPEPSLLTEAECKKAIQHSKEYDRLMQKARVCKRDSDCRAGVVVNLCSDCRVMVNGNSRHLRRLRALEEKYKDDESCRHLACATRYNCGRHPSGECTKGRCQTETDEPMPECGSPSRFPMPW
jgi:hypothetical protein